MNKTIEILCNGDFSGRDIARKYLTIGDLEEQFHKTEKAAATNSDQSQ